MIRQFATLLALLHAVSSSDCRWHNAAEFWSNVICSMKDIKTVNFHDVLESGASSIFLEQCLQAFVHDIARKCEATIVSRIHALRNTENAASLVASNDERADRDARYAKRSSIWKIASGDALTCNRVTPSNNAAGETLVRNDGSFDRDTWNVHVILTRDIRSFDQISRDDATTFKWNSHDRFIVLIARYPEEHGLSDEPDSKIDDILRTLWSRRKVQKIFVSEAILAEDTIRIVRTYNPFAKANDSGDSYVSNLWGEVEIINVKTAEEASSVLSQLTSRRTNNLNGYELKVGYFMRGETLAEPTKDRSNQDYAGIFKGFDELLLNTIARSMNFQVEHVHPSDNKSFGYRLPNGTYVGAIVCLLSLLLLPLLFPFEYPIIQQPAYTGDIVHGRTDICFVPFFVKKYSTNPKEDVDFSAYVDFDRLCVVVPKATKIPKGIRIYHFFPLSVWICSMLTHVFTYLTWYFLQVFTPGRTGKKSFRATIYRSFLLNAGCPQKLPNTNAERILLSGILLANVTLVGIFSGILYNSFAHDMYYPDIDSLRDLDASGLPVLSTSASLGDLFDDNGDVYSTSLMRSLRKKMQLTPDVHTLSRVARHRNASAFARESHFPIVIEDLIDADGGPLLHLVEECPGEDKRIDQPIERGRLTILVEPTHRSRLHCSKAVTGERKVGPNRKENGRLRAVQSV
ncbi:PREDICTED: uncharacterized protein LOC105557693 isoform X2 [Vollenhovia emeryi]|uniref:uncharacterized protein LOC105557693 isoform X2 n=1 Tax=Vollenhovia emeryi TaxID=411798 RepID=UPI0005F44FC6|nr:PREDICTED: uncharacterized protein LOC105557693 isoform X2 [Vollenhovia emeryi]